MATLNLEHSVVDNRYEVAKRLSLGSYAEIYTALDLQHNARLVILKALNTSLRGDVDDDLQSTLIENFQNEAVALDKVRHPNIVQRIGHGYAADLSGTPFYYLVFEYMSGGDLRELCRQSPLSLDDMLFYFGQVCDALAYAHRCGVIHRDIKPHNLLLTGDKKTVKIADFGVAKMAAQAGEEITRVGTDVYAPPEHHPLNEESTTGAMLTPSADIYSLAKTVYTLLTGSSPKRFSLRPINELPPDVAAKPWSGAMLRVLRRATDSKAEVRYHDIAEFRQAVEEAVQQSEEVLDYDTDNDATVVRSRSVIAPDTRMASSIEFDRPNVTRPKIVVSLPTQPAVKPLEVVKTPPPVREEYRKEVIGPVKPAPINGSRAAKILTSPAPQAPSPPISPRLNRWQRADLFLMRHRKVILLILGLILFVSLLAGIYHAVRVGRGLVSELSIERANAVVVREVSLREGPTSDSSYLGELHPGVKVYVTKAIGDNAEDWSHSWLQIDVIDWNGDPGAPVSHGYMHGSFAQKIAP